MTKWQESLLSEMKDIVCDWRDNQENNPSFDALGDYLKHPRFNWREFSADGTGLEPDIFYSAIRWFPKENRHACLMGMFKAMLYGRTEDFLDSLFGNIDKEKATPNEEVAK